MKSIKQSKAIVEEKTYELLCQQHDMSEIYYRLGTGPMFAAKKCPTLFCDMPMPDGFDYLTILYKNEPTLVYTGPGLSDTDVIKIATGKTKDYAGVVQACPTELERLCIAEYITKCNISTFYRVAAILARSMKIMCPKVIVLNDLSERAKTGRGNTVFNEKRIIHIEIYEKNDYAEIDMVEALAHEMRHCWQIENHYEKYFSKFKDVTAFAQNCREQYHLQPAEIDAIAYALRFVRAATGEDFEANTIFPNVNREIDQYAKALDDSLFEPFVGML